MKKVKNLISNFNRKLVALGALCCTPFAAFASTQDQYPWTQTLFTIMDSLDGPVAYAAAVIAMVVSGMVLAFTDLQGGSKKVVIAALGISVALGAAQIVNLFFHPSSAVIV